MTGIPLDADGAVGLMLTPVITASLTVREAVFEVIPSSDAVTDVVFLSLPVAIPVALAIAAIVVSAEAQVALLVISAVCYPNSALLQQRRL
jgi:hypothetical protein